MRRWQYLPLTMVLHAHDGQKAPMNFRTDACRTMKCVQRERVCSYSHVPDNPICTCRMTRLTSEAAVMATARSYGRAMDNISSTLGLQ